MAPHGPLVAAVSLRQKDSGAEGQEAGLLVTTGCPLGMAPSGGPCLPPAGHKQGTGLTRLWPTPTTRAPSGWYHVRLGRPETSSLGRESRAVTVPFLWAWQRPEAWTC